MNLKDGTALAHHIVHALSPHCEEIQIAGSIRRGKEQIKDVEIVVIPKMVEIPISGSLFGETQPVSAVYEWGIKQEFIRWIKPGVPQIEKWTIKPDGKYYRGLVEKGRFDSPEQIKLDLFIARRDNWGVIFTIRTGAAEFSMGLVTHIRDNTDFRVQGGDLTVGEGADRRTIACFSEQQFFQYADVKYIEPKMRRDSRDVRWLNPQ